MSRASVIVLVLGASSCSVDAWVQPGLQSGGATAVMHRRAGMGLGRGFSHTKMSAAGPEQDEFGAVAEGASRRGFFSSVAAAAVLSQTTLGMPSPALALSENEYLKRMKAYGLPPGPKVPDGFNPVMEFTGKAVAAQSTSKMNDELEPLLITFYSPSSWLVVRPNIDVNGEDGTVSAGDYGKGDSAALYLGPKPSGSLDSQDNKYFADLIYSGLTQKASVVQNLKVKKVIKLEEKTETPYYLVDYYYELITGAGFEIARRGCASVTQVGKVGVQVMITATTDIRYKKVENSLRQVAQSFRVYDKVISS